jgi:hypothetical protein
VTAVGNCLTNVCSGRDRLINDHVKSDGIFFCLKPNLAHSFSDICVAG